MSYFVFNFSRGDRERATELLRARVWEIGDEEQHRDDIAPGDVALVYVAADRVFVGRAEIATAVRAWTPSEADTYPGDTPSGVLLSHVEEWDPVVSMDSVVQRIDPTGSNPLVQGNAAAGFRTSVVRITDDEYEAALSLHAGEHGR